jgi:flagellar biosynthesis protein FlhF
MTVRFFRAPDLREALLRMQTDMGDNAVVLYQRRVATSRWWPFGARQWEVAAVQPAQDPVPPAYIADRVVSPWEELPIGADLAELKAKLTMLVQTASLARLPGCGEALISCYEELCRVGMKPELSQALVLAARDDLSSRAQTEPQVVEATTRRQIELKLQTRSPRVLCGSGPLVIFMLGPTGVGKTTTVAKLAARQALIEGRRVGIINLDTSRPGAHEQLDALIQPLNTVPVDSAITDEGFQQKLAAQSARDVVFVDTPGVGRQDRSELARLRGLAESAPRRQCFLVLNASTSLVEMEATLRSFQPIGLDGIILTKLDETGALGPAVSLACGSSVPIAYLTNGRRIPHDIQAATPEHLSGLLLGSVRPEAGSAEKEPARQPVSRPVVARKTPSEARRGGRRKIVGLQTGPQPGSKRMAKGGVAA